MAGQVAYLPVAGAAKIYQTASATADLNEATLSGAIDIIVVRSADGTLRSSPFHVRFGKFMILRPTDKVVNIQVRWPRCFAALTACASEAVPIVSGQ